MTELCVYGAGPRTRFFIPLLYQRYNILSIFDADVNKQGHTLDGIPITAVSRDDNSPVLICIQPTFGSCVFLKVIFQNRNNIIGAQRKFLMCLDDNSINKKEQKSTAECGIQNMESALSVLLDAGFKDILFAIFCEHYGIIFRYRPITSDLKNDLLSIIFNESPFDVLVDPNWDIYAARRFETTQTFDNHKPRVFNLALFPDEGQTGGSMAAQNNLRIANSEYHIIPNLFSINATQIFCPKDRRDGITNVKLQYDYSFDYVNYGDSFCSKLPLYNDITCAWSLFLVREALLQGASSMFSFSEDDVFILHDFRDVQAFTRIFPHFKNVFAGYHEQGALNSVMNMPDYAKLFYNNVQLKHLNTVHHWIFPSHGAFDGFYDTADDSMKVALNNVSHYIAYNGFTPKEIKTDEAKEFLTIIKSKREDSKMIFISATYLYKNKGVERIPRILNQIKQQFGVKVFWILIGDGEMTEVVSAGVAEYLSQDEYLWRRKRLVTQENLFALFCQSDFYLMMHYVSIFDLSILQAMAYGCVPFLSDVGGNKEFCGFNNGVLCDPTESDEHCLGNFADYIDQCFLASQKEKNKRIISECFNDKTFLQGYMNAIDALRVDA